MRTILRSYILYVRDTTTAGASSLTLQKLSQLIAVEATRNFCRLPVVCSCCKHQADASGFIPVHTVSDSKFFYKTAI